MLPVDVNTGAADPLYSQGWYHLSAERQGICTRRCQPCGLPVEQE